MQGRKFKSHRLEDDRLICDIWRASLDEFWSWRPGMVKNNSMSLKKMHEVGDEVLGMVDSENE